MEFKVGQSAYLPSMEGKLVELVTVDAIMISTDKSGVGGPYCYSIDTAAWDVCYRLSNGLTVHEGSLFAKPEAAFRHLEERATHAAAPAAA